MQSSCCNYIYIKTVSRFFHLEIVFFFFFYLLTDNEDQHRPFMVLQVFQLVLYAWYLYIVLTQLGLNWVLELKLVLLYVGQERDGMRAILESYDSELATSEYSPQLMLRVKEAEDMLQKVQTHNTEMEVRTTLPIMHTKSFFQKYLSKNYSEH